MSGLRVALRIAQRDARRARGRSALVIVMIALPLLGIGMADVAYRTFQLTPEQRASRVMGQADAIVSDVGAPIAQVDGTGYTTVGPERVGPPPNPLTVLPAGSRLLESRSRYLSVAAGSYAVAVTNTDLAYGDPLASGMFSQRSGRAPRATGEVALTEELAARMHVAVGGTVERQGQAARVTGIVRSESSPRDVTAFVVPGSFPDVRPERILVDVPGTLAWDVVRRANAAGFALQTRGTIPGQPPLPSVLRGTTTNLTFGGLIAGLALLEIVLLAGPAFAVGVKRRSADLALVAATGGERQHLRAIVLAGGVVLGAVGGVAGILGGVALARFLLPVFTDLQGDRPGPFEARPLELLLLSGIGVLTAVLAALIPARNAGRTDVLAALTGRRGAVRSGTALPVVGLVATAIGTGIAMLGAHRLSANTVLAGSIVAELGLVAMTPWLVGAVAHLGRWLPLAPRLALRDAARNRGRTAPAVSAILAAVAGAVAVGTFVASLDEHDRRNYSPQGPAGVLVVQGTRPAEVSRVVATVQGVLPGAEVLAVRGVALQGDGGAQANVEDNPALRCPTRDTLSPSQVAALLRDDPRCRYGRSLGIVGSGLLVGDSHVATLLAGQDRSAYDQVLRAGGAVVPANYLQVGGTVEVLVTQTGRSERRVTVPGIAAPKGSPTMFLLSDAAAKRVGLPLEVQAIVARGDHPLTTDEQDRARSAVERLGLESVPYLSVERGYHGRYGVGLFALLIGSALIVLGASGTATGLAAADGRADLSTLAAVGASPSTRRTLAASQSAVTAGLGAGLGVLAGLVPAIGVVRAADAAATRVRFQVGYSVVLPWTNLLVTALVVPLLAAAVAALFTRSRLPMVRRLA